MQICWGTGEGDDTNNDEWFFKWYFYYEKSNTMSNKWFKFFKVLKHFNQEHFSFINYLREDYFE